MAASSAPGQVLCEGGSYHRGATCRRRLGRASQERRLVGRKSSSGKSFREGERLGGELDLRGGSRREMPEPQDRTLIPR